MVTILGGLVRGITDNLWSKWGLMNSGHLLKGDKWLPIILPTYSGLKRSAFLTFKRWTCMAVYWTPPKCVWLVEASNFQIIHLLEWFYVDELIFSPALIIILITQGWTHEGFSHFCWLPNWKGLTWFHFYKTWWLFLHYGLTPNLSNFNC